MRLCVIPARGGSKRIPRKNIKEFFGQPIISYSINVAIASKCFDRVIVSTDDAEIAEVAKSFGADIPFMRPKQLSDDYVGTGSVTKHAIEWFESQGQAVSDVCCIYATAPLIQKDDLIKAHKYCKKLMPILHLPVQSGSSKVLSAMNRKHNILDYHEVIEKLKKAKPNIKFSSDFIIGYPGETDDDFKQTLNLIEKIKFINSYSFIYSSRPGTPASKLNNIDSHVAKGRLIKLQSILEENNSKYKKEFLDKTIEVLFENKLNKQNKYFGRDKFLNSVIVESKHDLTGQLLIVKVNDFNHNSLFGTISNNENSFSKLN